jgi:putative flavoprotein involved in K+ transport
MALDVRTGVTAERLDRGGTRWRLVTSAGVLEAERVVVATGHSNVPYLPGWPGSFPGDIVHSSAYRNPEPHRGRRMLVVGTGNSGAEIAVDLADGGAAEVSLAVRTPPSIVRRDTLGVPSQLFGIASGRLPAAAVDRIAYTIRRASIPDLEPYGLPAPARPYSQFLARHVVPILDVGLVEAVRKGRVRIVAPVERFDDGAAVLADGTTLSIDGVIAATGYRTGLEPLVGHLGVLDPSGEPLVHAAREHPDAPGLHFVGYQPTLGGTFRLVGREARQLADAV